MTWLWRLLLFLLGESIKGQVVLRAKRRGVIAYIKALQGTRRALVFAVLALFIFQSIVIAGFAAFVTGMFLLELERRTMLWILFGVFLAMFLVPVLAIAVALNERVWYRVSGAKKMVDDLGLETSDASKAA